MNLNFFIDLVILLLIGIYLLRIVLEWLADLVQNTLSEDSVVVLSVQVTQDNETGPLVAEQIFATLHSIATRLSLWNRLRGVHPEKISLEIANIGRSIKFFIYTPKKLRNLIEGQIYAQYPHVEIEEVTDYTLGEIVEVSAVSGQQVEGREKMALINKEKSEEKKYQDIDLTANAIGAELTFFNKFYFPIKSYRTFEDKSTQMNVDPLSGITSTLAKFNNPDEQAWLQLVIAPIPEKIQKKMSILADATEAISSKFLRHFYYNYFWKGSNIKKAIFAPLTFFFKPHIPRHLPEEKKKLVNDDVYKQKMAKLLYKTRVRIIYIPKVKNPSSDIIKLKEIAGSFKQFNNEYNGFVISKIYTNNSILKKYRNRILDGNDIMNIEELATVYHFPNNTVLTPNIFWVKSKKIDPPNDLPKVLEDENSPVTAIGCTNFRDINQIFGIKTLDRRRHMYIIGKTGMGKSVLLENMIYSDIQCGRGVAIVDPHGDLAETILDFIPSWRTNDVIIFDPSDREHPIAFNMLENVDPALNTIIASGLVGIFKKIYGNSWGPRLEHILRNTILSLLEYPNTTILGIPRILQDETFRRRVIRKIQDPLVKSFWLNEFEKMEPRQKIEAISPILNKVGQFLSSPIIRNILGQVKSKLDFRFAMDHKKIIIINLSKGKIGEDNSSLLGAMLITKFQIDAMSRANIPEKDRTDFYLYVDEFQNFATDSFATILSEARKYRLNLTMANQYIAQMPEEVRDAVFGNVGSILSFQVGYDDAEYISKQFSEEVMPNDLVNLNKHTAYMRLLIDGMPSKTFSLATLPPVEFDIELSRKEKVIKLARERYTVPKAIVEDKINRWSKGIDVEDEDNILIAQKQKSHLKPKVFPAKPDNLKPNTKPSIKD